MSQLGKQQVRALLRVVQSPEVQFQASRTLKEISAEFHVGRPRGVSLLFQAEDKAQLRALLRAEGIDPATDPAAWDGITRAEALRLGPNEKLTRTPVKRRRVAIKALPGQAILWAGQPIPLPPGAHMDVDAALAVSHLEHNTALLVENWECFERIQDIDPALNLAAAGANPLVVWRGDASGTSPDHALGLLRTLGCPVWAFVDYDPAGLLIALRTPGFAGLIVPPLDRLERDMASGLADRYLAQLPGSAQALDACSVPEIQALWALLRRHGRALPQERYLSTLRA